MNLTLQVKASANDCEVQWYNNTAWIISYTSQAQSVGYYGVNNLKYGGGMRFLNVTIANGSTINSAYLKLRARASDSVTIVNSVIIGEAVDDATPFSNIANYQARRGTVVGGANDNNITVASINWDAIPAWTLDTDYNSPEIKTIIQEIVNRAGWVNGNDMGIFWDDHAGRSTVAASNFRRAYSYNGSATYAPQLVIDYTPPAFIPKVMIF